MTDRVSNATLHNTDYTYDALGRIAGETVDGDEKTYTYDSYGQLAAETDAALDKKTVYVYNDNGCITSIKHYNTADNDTLLSTESFTYDATYPDRLTSSNGKAISYDPLGHPTSYDGWTLTWANGKLARVSRGTLQTGYETYTYTYDAYGRRIKKVYEYSSGLIILRSISNNMLTKSTSTYTYDNGGRLIGETINDEYDNNNAPVTRQLLYIYDANSIIGMRYNDGTATNIYYFNRNLQGDVTEIYTANGVLKVKYTYDAFGNCTVSGTDTSLGNLNPIRYRGYYYDKETNFYHLGARYYNPEWRRFISPDDTSYIDPETPNGLNLYCYCNNDPINFVDPSGHMPEWLMWLIGGAVITGLAIATIATGGAAGGVAGFIVAGALKGAVIGSISGAVTSGLIGGISSAIGGEGFWLGFANGAARGFMSGAIIGGVTGAISSGVQVYNASKMWQPGTSPRTSTSFKTMTHHYKKHVINEGFSKGNNIVKYTRDAVRFMNRNAASLKYQVPHNAGLQPFWTVIDKVGLNGQFTSAGKILTFWYVAL